MFFNLAVNLILSAIKEAVKNPAKRASLRVKLLQIRDAITLLYPDESPTLIFPPDPDL